jgi:hypothetical protein
MKKLKNIINKINKSAVLYLVAIFCLSFSNLMAQSDSTTTTQDSIVAKPKKVKSRSVRDIFKSNYILDNQTVNVNPKRSLEMVIQHRFGTINNGYSDFYGIYSPATIRIGIAYVPVNNVQLGFGFCKYDMNWDGNAKVAILRQNESNSKPVSITYFGNVAVDTRAASNFVKPGDRFSYFDQLLVARKFSDALSLQVGLSLSHFNNIPGYLDSNNVVQSTMKNDNFSFHAMGRYTFQKRAEPKTAMVVSILFNYDQPLTQNFTNNPMPNLSLGLEIATAAHDFQVVFSNYQYVLPQYNNTFNQNDYRKGMYCIGFNITRLWHL